MISPIHLRQIPLKKRQRILVELYKISGAFMARIGRKMVRFGRIAPDQRPGDFFRALAVLQRRQEIVGPPGGVRDIFHTDFGQRRDLAAPPRYRP